MSASLSTVGRRSIVAALAGLSALPSALAAQHAGHDAQAAASDVGLVEFPTSATPAAHAEFVRGVALLHNFLYPEAAQAFRRARSLDSGDVMSAAFEALTHTHAVWNEQDVAAGRAALRSLGPTRAARLARARTSRERAWLDAIEALYDGDAPKAVRDTAFSAAVAKIHAADPRDVEAAAFYALSLLGLNQGVREPVAYAHAEAIADSVLRVRPRHPGALHYKIHAVDDPANAERGLDAAGAYGTVAPAAHHALHMTSHIYMARGMWDDVVAMNRRAVAAAPRFSGHYTLWLVYGLLQQGRPREARAWVDSMFVRAREAVPGDAANRTMMAMMVAATWIIDAEAWDDALTRDATDRRRAVGGMQVAATFVRGYAAARRAGRAGNAVQNSNPADRATADSALAFLTARTAELRASSKGRDDGPSAGEVEEAGVVTDVLRAELLVNAGRADSAVMILRAAAARWEAQPFAFGPPAVLKPPRERAAELLLSALGKPADALAQADSAERMTPGRTQLELVRARALAALGRRDEAREAYATLARVWHLAEPTFWGLAEAREGSRER